MDEAKNVQDGISDTIDGATIDDYVIALSWLCLGMGRKTLLLENTDGANALKYKILTYANENGIVYEEVAETEITAGNLAQVILEHAYAKVVVQVKSSVGSTPAGYELDWVGNRN
ncbi:MAG: hypothetical protein U9N01_04510 [Euryarchaeota archaeon]|nr:hypothetical protein [Euryarchaeota archaeon]